MPEMNQSKKHSCWSLEDAWFVGHILVVRCSLCNVTRRWGRKPLAAWEYLFDEYERWERAAINFAW